MQRKQKINGQKIKTFLKNSSLKTDKMEMNNLMIDRLNAERELQGKIVEMLMPMQPEAAELKAEEILKLAFNFYVSSSADDECFYCQKLRNDDGSCNCAESW